MTPYPHLSAFPTASRGPLFSPTQIFGASFLGTPLAGAWLLASNFRALGDDGASHRWLTIGTLSTIALLGVAFALPPQFPRMVFPALAGGAMLHIANTLQGAAYRSHVQAGGSTRSARSVFRVVLVVLLLVFVALVTATTALPNRMVPG